MNTFPHQVVGLPVSFDSYIRHGWSLVPIPPNTKGPKTPEWNKKENCLVNSNALPAGWGVGLAHAYSGTMALDVDMWAEAELYLHQHGINLRALFDAPDAVTVNSGKSGHGKLLYAMPFGIPMRSKKLIKALDNGTKVNYLDFRCATADGLTVQDVMPPSVHPETRQPYQWGGKGKWDHLPTIPFKLLTLWQNLIEQDSAKVIATGTAVDASWDDIREALYAIPSDTDRDEWVQVGMALHYAGTQTNQIDQAHALWDEWSATGLKYKGVTDIMNCWRSFKADNDGVKLGTLFHIASKHGYKRPAPDIAGLFSSIVPVAPNIILDQFHIPPPDIDLSLFPPVLAQRAKEVGVSVGCDPVVPLMAGLAAACAAADARIRLELMDGWKVPPVLWLMTIGNPADKKTPAARPMLGILKDLEMEDLTRYQMELLKWEALSAAHAASKKSHLTAAAAPENMLSGKLDMSVLPMVTPEPVKPVQLRMTVDDVTSQKLIRMGAERPRGLLAHLDEMHNWAKKLTATNSSEDGSTWTKAYEADRQTMDRVGDGKIDINISASNFAVAIYGNIQPEVLRKYMPLLATDGTLQRFIPVILRAQMSDRLNTPMHVSMSNTPQYEEMIRRIFSIGECTYRLSEGAYESFRAFQQWYLDIKRDDRMLLSGNAYMTALGKLEGTCGRLMLMFHFMTNPHDQQVSKENADRVITFIKSFVLPTLRHVYGEVGGEGVDSLDYYVMEHIAHMSGELSQITLRDLKRSARRRLDHLGISESRANLVLTECMENLEAMGWVLQIQGDRRSTIWAINPAIGQQHAEYRRQVIAARQRRKDYIHECSGGKVPRIIVRGYTGE